MHPLLTDRVAIVTGASQGLGLEIARRYLREGASVAICARNGELLGRAHAELQAETRDGQDLVAVPADVSDPNAVNAMVQEVARRFGRIDILVNNAAIYGPMGGIEEVDWSEWVRAIQINLCGSVLTCRAVLPFLKANNYGKIVQLSGGGATSPLPRISAYAVSKAGIVRFVETLAEEVRPYRIDVNAIAPGALNTRMLDEVLAAGPEKVGSAFYERALQQSGNGGAPLGRGADLAVFLASGESDGITGKLISAIWDPWETLPRHLDELKATDIYTLRRIGPADRGRDWGER